MKKRGNEELEGEELRALGEELDDENYKPNGMIGADPEGDDDVDGWVDEVVLMSTKERARLEQDTCPVRLALTKVSHNSPGIQMVL